MCVLAQRQNSYTRIKSAIGVNVKNHVNASLKKISVLFAFSVI